MRPFLCAAAGVWLMLAGQTVAQSAGSNAVLVELYTSQGCSSCPPADAALEDLASRDGVLALAFHVDYWDYIGWKDTLADPANTKRQRAYAAVAGARTIYTPQMIIGGMDHVVGARPAEVDALVRAHAGHAAKVDMTLSRQGGKLSVRAKARTALPNGAIVQLVRYSPRETIAIGRGENAGRTIDYVNTVLDLKRVATWDGRSDLRLDVPADGKGEFAVIIQEPGPGPVLAAAALR
ncbi:MAG: DUF1223 domain-containing protein [Rhodobacteraceae bacterium]|nr:DUF1223 domain-containing protein [Paracoccaceae bacterium]